MNSQARTYILPFVCLIILGCGTSQEITSAELDRRVKLSQAALVSDYTNIRRTTIAIASDKLDAWQRGERKQQPTLDILILSSGGPDGAFGAGVLEGWGEIKDPALKRPKFDWPAPTVHTNVYVKPRVFPLG